MTPTDEILKMAPSIIRTYSLSFLLLPLNIFSTYYFGAILKPKIAFMISISRGLVISGILITILPTIFGNDSIWLTMPITEIPVMLYAIFNIYKYTESLPMLTEKQFI